MRKIFGLLALLVTGVLAATSALYLHHERSTQATVEADCQNREVCLDKTNLAPIGRFNDGTLWHGVTQEKPNVNLTGTLTVTGATVLSNNLTLSLFATGRIPYTTTAGLLTSGTGLTYNGSAFSVAGTGAFSGAVTISSALGVTGGNLTVGSNSTAWDAIFNGPTANNRNIFWQTAGLNRWKIFTNGTAESGSNAGSDFSIQAYNDAGSLLGTALTITRSNRQFAISDNATVGGTLGVTGNTTITGNLIANSSATIGYTSIIPGIRHYVYADNFGGATTSRGIMAETYFSSGVTTGGTVIEASFGTMGTAFTMATGRGILIGTPTIGSTTVTNLVGLEIASQTGGGTNYAIRTGASGLIQLGSLTASSAVATDASKNLISVTNTGTGNNVLSASPTLTGTINAASQTLSGTLGVTGVTTATGGLALGASFVDKTILLTSNTTLTSAHSAIFASAAGGSFTLTLPAASGNTGLTYTIYKTDGSSAATGGGPTVTIDGNASETVGGALTQVLASNTGNGRIKIICDGSNWRILELYDEGSFIGTLTGCTTSPTTTIYYSRINSNVTINLAASTTGTSNSTSMTITGLPSSISPTRQVFTYGAVFDNGISISGTTLIAGSSTTITFGAGVATTGGFTASGLKGIATSGYTFTYNQQ